MRLKRLQLSNFRKFRGIEILLPDSLEIAIIGMNGSGKTSLLDSIALCMSHFTGKLISNTDAYDIDSWFVEDDISFNQENSQISLTFQLGSVIDHPFFADPNQDKIISLTKQRGKSGFSFDKHPKGFLNILKREIKAKNLTALPIVSYFPVTRTHLNSKESKSDNKSYDPKLNAYANSLDIHNQSFKKFEKWFIQQINLENSLKVKENNLDFELKSLGVVRNAFLKFLNKIDDGSYQKILVSRDSKVDSKFEETTTEYLAIQKGDVNLKFKQLSYGERMVISLVCQIAMRLAIANEEIKDSLKGDGIVLIDEIDLHLHPVWQKRIVQALRTTFPNIQFIFASHSPMILSGIRRENIILLGQEGLINNMELPDVFTGTADEILEKILLSKSSADIFESEKATIEKLFLNMEFDKAMEELKELEEKIDSSPKWLLDIKQRLDFVTNDAD